MRSPLCLFPILGVLAGCGSVRAAREAQEVSKAIMGERTPSARELGIPTAGAITLRQVEAASLRANPAIVIARRNAEAAEARIGEVEGAYYPQISSGPVAQYRYETLNSAGQTEHDRGHSFQSFGFGISWLIFDFGRTPAIVRQTAKQALSQQELLRNAELDTVFNVRQAFFNLEKQRALLVVADDTVRQFETRLAQTKAFVEVGTRVPYDLTKAEVDLGNAKLTQVQTADAVRIADAQLANAIGVAEVTEWAPTEGAALPAMDLTFEQAWQYAIVHEPRIASARAVEAAASALVDAQIAALWPTITLSAGYTAGGLDFPLTWNWNVGPNLNWVLFNGFTNYYTIDEAAANLRGTRAQRVSTEQEVWLEVRTNYIALEDAKSRLDLSALIIQSAEENLTLAKGRYEVGKASAVDLTDAQVGLTQARGAQVQARADFQTALAQLWKALGRVTWDRPSPWAGGA
jgi:outer membrane protein TolC